MRAKWSEGCLPSPMCQHRTVPSRPAVRSCSPPPHTALLVLASALMPKRWPSPPHSSSSMSCTANGPGGARVSGEAHRWSAGRQQETVPCSSEPAGRTHLSALAPPSPPCLHRDRSGQFLCALTSESFFRILWLVLSIGAWVCANWQGGMFNPVFGLTRERVMAASVSWPAASLKRPARLQQLLAPARLRKPRPAAMYR